jgi:cyclopropane fatty-acyl-phospholipid synthase-like methyltransferase
VTRADAYDPDWLLRVSTVANVAWLTESLAEHMPFEPGMRVLDLGCGRGGSSIFLAREFGVTVYAVDTMIRPDEIFEHVEAFGLADQVLPQHADARRLPFPSHYFDAVVSIGAFQYFATENMYLTELSRFVRPGGRIGMVSEGLSRHIDGPPDYFSPSWHHAFSLLHTPEWWRRHWEREGFHVESADLLPDGVPRWAEWYELCIERGVRPPAITKPEAAMLRADAGRTLGLVRAIAGVG